MNRPDVVDPGRDVHREPTGPGDHPAEAQIHTSDSSARRSPHRIVRGTVAVAATALLTLGLSTAPSWAAAPANDELAGATPIALGDQIVQDTTQATTSDADTTANKSCGLPSTEASVWFTFTATADRGFAVDTTASSYGAAFMVFEGAPSATSEIGCGFGREDGLAAHAGKTYTIVVVDVDMDQTNGGTLVLDLEDRGPLPSLEVTLDPKAGVDKTGAVRLSGTYSCTLASRIGFDIQLSEAVGRFTVNGFGSFNDDNPCDGSTIPFTLVVSGYDGKFAGGKAIALVSTDACGATVCDGGWSRQTIQLTKGR